MAKAAERDDLDGMIKEFSKDDPDLPDIVEALTKARQLMRQLVDARTKKGLSQKQVAERLGTTQSAIARLEAGDLDPKLSTAMKYAVVVNATLQVNPRAR